MSFWTPRTGKPITGSEESSFAADMSVIPSGTTAVGCIKNIVIKENENPRDESVRKFIEVKVKLLDGEYIGREVTLKIKPFYGTDYSIDRGLNMLKRLMDLCGHKPSSGEEPNDNDFSAMVNKVMGVKIEEWSFIGDDGNTREGNYISEIHASAGFTTATGVKSQKAPRALGKSPALESYESYSASTASLVDDDVPY